MSSHNLSIQYSSLPAAIVASTATEFDIINTLPDNAELITNFTVDLAIAAPDEGSGPDPTLLEIRLQSYLLGGPYEEVYLHSVSADDLTSVNYDNDREPYSGAGLMNVFDVDDAELSSSVFDVNNFDFWKLIVFNFGVVDGTLNDYTVNITYTIPDPPTMPPQTPSAPNARSLLQYVYGTSSRFGRRKNIKKVLISNGTVTTSSLIDSVVVCPFNGRIEGIRYAVVNSGSGGNQTKLSLKKFSNGVVTTLVNSNIIVPTGLSYGAKTYPLINFTKEVNSGDVLFFTVDEAATSISDLAVELILSERE